MAWHSRGLIFVVVIKSLVILIHLIVFLPRLAIREAEGHGATAEAASERKTTSKDSCSWCNECWRGAQAARELSRHGRHHAGTV
jgi:hypothetical protein